jgi:hypothetical protein
MKALKYQSSIIALRQETRQPISYYQSYLMNKLTAAENFTAFPEMVIPFINDHPRYIKTG